MEYTKLGNTDIEVSKLCIGCMSFGEAGTMHDWTLNEQESEKIICHALELGYNFFDTANCYSAGTSEEYLGKILKKHTARENVVIASKVYFNEDRLSKKRSRGKSTRHSQDLAPIILTFTSYTVLTMTPRSKKQWKRSMNLSRSEKSVRLAHLPCTATNFITCSRQPESMDGRRFLLWKIITTCFTGKMNGNCSPSAGK